jgi:type I restriction enzyme S subunit
MLPIKRISKIRYGLSQPPAESPTGLPLIRATNIKSGKILIEDMMYVDPTDIPLSKDAILSKGDIIVVRSGAYTGDSAIIPNEYDGAIAGYDIVVTVIRDLSPFVAWQLLSPHVREFQFELNSLRAAQPHLNAEQLGETLIFVPPLPEQHAIAYFLYRETAKIDALIEKKRRLISLLEEKRAAIISQAVTKGLDPDASMKDSGVEWLGGIPTGWNLLQLRRVINKFVDYRGATPEKVPNGIPLITAKNIKMNKIDFELSQEFIREEDYSSWMVRGLPEIGDVLVTTEAPLGESAQIVDPNIALAQRIILLKADKVEITNDYLKYYFASSSGKSELWSRATGSTALGIKASRFKETLLTVPPINEQQMITELLDRETLKSYKLVSKINEQINKLQEYRTALISAAVTGKIDVREASL